MATRIYSFRAPEGLVPPNMSTGSYIRELQGKPKSSAGWATGMMTAILTLLPVLLIMAVHNRKLNRQMDELKRKLNEK